MASVCCPAILVAVAASVVAWQNNPVLQPSPCRVAGPLVRVPDLSEGSGVAASRRTPGLFWAHNDSGDPIVFALDHKGSVTQRIRVTGADVDDWEDIAVGPCAQQTCLYIADIGDNSGRRKQITLYRTPEPAPADAATAPVEVFHAAYPDGAHDAEALFITPGSDVFIVTKGDPGPVALYRFPRPLTPGTTHRLQRVGEPPATGKVDAKDRPTAAGISQDGRWVAVRTTDYIRFFRTADLIEGRWRDAFRTDVTALDEPRGEGITFAANGDVILVGEGGGLTRRPGTFATLSCAWK
jgi:hypothetical protein